MVKRDVAAARHGSMESSGADTLKAGIGGGKLKSDGYMNGRDGRYVYFSAVSSNPRRVPTESTSVPFAQLPSILTSWCTRSLDSRIHVEGMIVHDL